MTSPQWKQFEDDVQKYFKKRMEVDPIVYHRFYDTHSAGSFLPSQPADHLVQTPGHTVLVETKYSEVHNSLRSCFSSMVDDTQIAHMRIWMRAGAVGLIAFKGKVGIEVWEGGHCAYCRLNGLRLNPSHILSVGSTVDEAFDGLMLEFPGSEMKWRLFND